MLVRRKFGSTPMLHYTSLPKKKMGDPSNVLYARRAELMEQKENAKILEGRTRMRVENSAPALSL